MKVLQGLGKGLYCLFLIFYESGKKTRINNYDLEADENFEISTYELTAHCSTSELTRLIVVPTGIEPAFFTLKG